MGGVLAPETKVRRVMKARLDKARAVKKRDNFAATRAKYEALLAKLTDEEFAKREEKANTASKAVAWLEGAPVSDEAKYAELLAEAEANQGTDENEGSDDEDDADAA
jgi:hypothetical protein